MTFHLAAWTQNQNSSAGLLPVNAFADPTLPTATSFITVLGSISNLAGGFAFGATLTRAQILSPSLRNNGWNEELDPVQTAMTNSGPHNIADNFRNPIPLLPNEQIQAQVSSSAAGEQDSVFAWFSDGPLLPVGGNIRSVRVSSATALVANSWSNCTLTMDQQLPAGTYSLVGARFRSTGLVAFRFVFPGAFYRPGGLGRQAATIDDDYRFRDGYLGEWGRFTNLTVPTVDVWSTSADSAETGILDLVKVG